MEPDVYAGGLFTQAGLHSANHIAKWDPVDWEWEPLADGVNGEVKAIAVSGTDVYVGGQFTAAGGLPANNIARWDSASESWSPLGIGTNGPVWAITVSGTDVYVGGEFTAAGEISANCIAKWDGLTWSALGSGIGGTYPCVYALAVVEGDVYVGGSFSQAGGKPSFSIARWINPFSVTSPNGAERWDVGSIHPITWKGASGPVKIEYTADHGYTWTTIAESADNTGRFDWTVPNMASPYCRVRVSEVSAGDSLDSSDGLFTIVGLRVFSPDGGEQWIPGTEQTIVWKTTCSSPEVKIELSVDNGATWEIITPGTTNNGLYAPWTVPAVSSSQCLIRVSDSIAGTPSDTSNDVFIIGATTPTIMVTSPNGGESWEAGSTHSVTWTQTGLTGSVAIDFYKGGAFSRSLGTTAATAGSLSWTIGASEAPGVDYQIRVWQGSISDDSDGDFAIITAAVQKDDFLGTWDGQGVYYRNSDTGAWVKLASPATKIAVGDLDGDGIDDLIGLWPGQGGIWVKYSQSGAWAKLSSTAQYIAAGDMNGDGRVDLVGTWDGQGVFYRNSITGAWVKMATPATMVTAGDIDNDGTDDLIGLWPSQGGIWVKYSQTGTWAKLSSTAVHIAAGDMNGDERDDLLGTWDGQGVYYRDSATGAWVKMASPATLITTGDIDGDAIDDLIGIWPTQGGVWVKYSSDGTWERLSSTAQDIAAGKMRAASGGGETQPEGVLAAQQELVELPLPMGGNEEGPGVILEQAGSLGPGAWRRTRFVYLEDINLEPNEDRRVEAFAPRGPGRARVQSESRTGEPLSGCARRGQESAATHKEKSDKGALKLQQDS